MKKYFYGLLLVVLIISTTLVKNSTKNIDKKIFNLFNEEKRMDALRKV